MKPAENNSQNPHVFFLEQNSVFQHWVERQDEVNLLVIPDSITTKLSTDISDNIILQRKFSEDKSLIVSVFSNKTPGINDNQIKFKTNNNNDWVFWGFFISLLLVAVFIFRYNKRISQMFKAFFIPHFTNQLYREGRLTSDVFTFPLLVVYFVGLTLLTNKIADYFFNIHPDLINSLIIFGFISFYFIFKNVFINFLGFVFKTSKETFEYISLQLLFAMVLGIFLFPFSFLFYFTPGILSDILMYFVVIVGVLVILFRLGRSFLIGLRSEQYNLYYLFLYLCTVEILPIIIIVNLFQTPYFKGFFIK